MMHRRILSTTTVDMLTTERAAPANANSVLTLEGIGGGAFNLTPPLDFFVP